MRRKINGETFLRRYSRFFDLLGAGDADIFFDKAIVGAQEAGHQEVEEAPELIERIFDRRTGQDQAVLRLDHFDRFGIARAAVFDVLRFIEDHVTESDRLVMSRYLFAAEYRR